MDAQSNTLSIIVNASALVSGDERPLAIIHGVERALSGTRLEWTLSETGDAVALIDRDRWVAAGVAEGGLPFVCNDDANRPMTLFGLENPAGLHNGGGTYFQIHGSLHLDAVGIASAVDALEAIGDAAHAFWGDATPLHTGAEISRQTIDPVRKPGSPPRGLPPLRFPDFIRAPEIPHRLGWLNYWSAAAARAVGFPDPARDAELLSRVRRTATGGWVVRLTEAPLDLDDPAHLDALMRAYARFPEIGGRAPA